MQKHIMKENARNTNLTKLNEVYKCNVCGNIIEMVHASTGTLVCCGQSMELLKEKTNEIGNEKHVPVVEIKEDKIIVTIGSILHHMENEHYIEWIEIITDDQKVYKKFLKLNDKPQAEFRIRAKKLIVREYCSVHGLWKKLN
jgi:superoxide reductase